MKRKNGFTLIELLAVIIILGILLVVLGNSIIGNIASSKEKIKKQAAKEIVELAKTYMATESNEGDVSNEVSIVDLINKGYVEENATNPFTGENDLTTESSQCIFKKTSEENERNIEGYQYYNFDKYYYVNQACGDLK